MEKLVKIERIRMTVGMTDKLNQLKKYGIKKPQFVRDAIMEKIQREVPKILAREKSNRNLVKIPF